MARTCSAGGSAGEGGRSGLTDVMRIFYGLASMSVKYFTR
jgi:hypothetical protein